VKLENLAHTLAAAVLCKAGLEKKTPAAMPALLIAANLPDLDVFGVLFGENYLDFHRGITHAAVGVPCLSAGLAGLFWCCSRALDRDSGRRLKFTSLWYVCLLGVLSHPILDFLNDYGLRPWLPFNPTRYYGDLVGIVDPWMWVIFGSALFLVTRLPATRLLWALLATALAALIAALAGWGLCLLWAALLCLAVWGAATLRRRGLHPARVALVVFLIYLGGVEVLRNVVLAAARADGPALIPEKVLKVDVLPRRPGHSDLWTVVFETADQYYLAEVGLQNWRRNPPVLARYYKNLDDACFRQALVQDQMAVMSRFARFPSVSIVREGNSCTVLLRDLRYARETLAGWGVVRATVPAP
jgi:membrane-bound metal-dependent hydrolase YbcI (DUF457 family)